VKAVLEDIIGHGNDSCLLPGQVEADAAKRSKANDGLLFSLAEVEAFNQIATDCDEPTWDPAQLVVAK
jgi:L-2-hydroxycarboxylate dehydrogenase (NAD+)